MRKSNYIIVFITMMATTLFISCKDDARPESTEVVTKDKGTSILIKSTLEQKEWEQFKLKTDSIIKENDLRIAELKIKLKNRKVKNDTLYFKKIKIIEEKNQALKTNLDSFAQKTTKNWSVFKQEFSTDLQQFEKSFDQFATEFANHD